MLEMIMNEILPNIFEIVITVISLVISYYIVPCIKADLVPFLKEKRIYNIVKTRNGEIISHFGSEVVDYQKLAGKILFGHKIFTFHV